LSQVIFFTSLSVKARSHHFWLAYTSSFVYRDSDWRNHI